MALTLHQLKIFRSVVEEGGITAAATKLHMTQPAVSIQIKQLEEHFGLSLIEVIGRKVYATNAGKKLYSSAVDIQASIHSLEIDFSHMKGCLKGRLSIAVVSTAKYFIPALLGEFHRKYPNVAIQLKVTNRGEVLERLENNVDDMAILSQLPQKLNILSEQILEDELVIPVPPEHALVNRRNIKLSDLSHEPFLMREAGSGTRMVMEQLLAKHNIEPKVVMELGSSSAIRQAVIAGFGLSMLSKVSIEQDLILNNLKILDIVDFPVRHPWYAVTLKDKQLSPVAQNFLQMLLEKRQEYVGA